MRIKVKQKDIDKGQAENIKCCAIALALRRAFKTDMVEVKTDDQTNKVILQIDDNEYDHDCISKSDHIISFMSKFDIGEEVKPFEFELSI